MKNNQTIEEPETLWNLLRIFITITLLFILFYLITSIITGYDVFAPFRKTVSPELQVEINYDYVTSGTMLNKSQEQYYVLAFHGDDREDVIIQSVITAVINENSNELYYLDLKDGMNQSLITNEVIKDELTLLVIEDNNIKKIITGEEDIRNYLKY